MADHDAPETQHEEHTPASNIEQHGGDRSIQVGQVFGNVVFQILTPKIVLILLVALAVIAAGVFYWRYRAQKPEVMTGDFNIAIAQFYELNAQGKETPTKLSSKISQELTGFLKKEFGDKVVGVRIEVAHDRMPIIPADGHNAAQLATDVHANLVIYGSVDSLDNQAEFSPRFYVAERPEQSDMNELTGSSLLDATIDFDPSTLTSQKTVHAVMQSRAAILVNFTRGLIYLSQYFSNEDNEDLSKAADAFQRAIKEVKPDQPFEGQEVLYLFAATIARLQKNFEQSLANIDQALRLNKDYARAYIARGLIYYEQAMRAAYDNGKFQQALTEYNYALNAQDQPEGAYIREKAQIAIGNVYTMLAQNTQNVELYAQALHAYQQGVGPYEKTRNTALQHLAGAGYYGLGVVYECQENYVQAHDVYQKCVEIAEQNELKVECLRGLGQAYESQGNDVQARETYQKCIELTEREEMKVQCLRGLGQAYYMQGEYSQGIAAYQQCIDLNVQSPYTTDCFAGLGDVYAKMGDHSKSIEAYQQCVQLADEEELKDSCSAKLSAQN